MAFIKKEQLESFKSKANELVNRTLDQHVNLAVTGLSRSGKTAFISSVVNQLLNHDSNSQLQFFSPAHSQRLIAAKRVPQKHYHIARFDYEGAIDSLSQTPPQWPAPTKGISKIRLAIKYRPQSSLLQYATDSRTLYVDITDYPGEWLLDLPMLAQTYEEWSEQMESLYSSLENIEEVESFKESITSIDPFAAVDEAKLAELAHEYTKLLLKLKNEEGFSIIQPGRFVLPGELADTPILQFVPFFGFKKLNLEQYQFSKEDTNIGMLRARYLEYRERVVKAFYDEHFVHFDRQIVLVDCLQPLNKGADNFRDLQKAMEMILESFNYGKSSLIRRLFSPKIDKLLFAATKADHVTPDQHANLSALLNQLIHKTKQQLSYDGVEMKTIALSSIKATLAGKGEYQGESIPVIQGHTEMSDRLITLFPGEVPDKLPADNYWQENQFNFINFRPYQSVEEHEALPHIRVDQVLQFLIGDKMK